MAVAFDAFSQSHAETAAWSVSQTSFSWSHDPVATPRCAVVFVMQGVSATNAVTSVTYAGTTMTAVTGGRAIDTVTEPGSCEAYFLDNVPSNDPATVVVNRTNNTTQMVAVCITMTAAGPCEIGPNIGLVEQNAAWAVQSIDDGSPGTDSLRLAGTYTGAATFPPAGTGSTMAGQFNPTVAYSAGAVRETTPGQGARNVGFSSGTADDHAEVALAVRETPPPILVEDDFNRANSDTVGNDSLGNAWVEVSGDWDIFSNGVIQTDATTTPGLLRCGTNIAANHWIEVTLAVSNGTGQVGFCTRVHATAFTGVFMEVADGFYKVIEVTNGSPSTVSTGSAHTHTTGERYRAESEGTTVRLFLNDTQVHSFTTSFAAGNTRIGLHLNENASGAVKFVNLRAGTLPYTAPSNDVEGSAAGSYTYSGTGAGNQDAFGTATGDYTYSGAGAGNQDAFGTAAGDYTYTGAGAGVAGSSDVEGSASGAYTYEGTGAGQSLAEGTASGAYTYSGTGAGQSLPEGAASGAYTYSGTGTGNQDAFGAASGEYTYAGAGVGEGGVVTVEGTAAGSYTHSSAAAGSATAGTFEGSASATYIHEGLAAGVVTTFGSATGIYTYTGGAFLAPPIPDPGWPVTLTDPTQTVTLTDPPQSVMLVDADSTVSLVDATQGEVLSDSDNAVSVTDPDQNLVF